MKKISKIERQKYNKNRYSIFLSGEYAFSISEDTLIEHRILKGRELEEDFIEEVLLSEERNKAKTAAFNYLAYRMRSIKEVERKLKSLGYEDFIYEIIDYLVENKYLDDQEYAISFCKDKINLKGYGKNRIVMELKERGIDSNIIDNALEISNYYDREYDIAFKKAEKRMKRSYKDSEDRYRKIYSYLLRQGYGTDLIKKVLDELLNR